VADFVGFLDAMRIRRANLAGHSVAGSEMTRFAGRHGDRVSRLVHLDAAVDYKFLGEIAAEAGLEPRDPALAAIIQIDDETHIAYGSYGTGDVNVVDPFPWTRARLLAGVPVVVHRMAELPPP
jgi:pimeloyl-ACP methyl ester carboxylesterase